MKAKLYPRVAGSQIHRDNKTVTILGKVVGEVDKQKKLLLDTNSETSGRVQVFTRELGEKLEVRLDTIMEIRGKCIGERKVEAHDYIIMEDKKINLKLYNEILSLMGAEQFKPLFNST